MTVAILCAALAFYCWDGVVAAAVFERERILAGEWWRVWTGHLVHFGGAHLFWNLLVVAVAGGWAELRWPGRTRTYFCLGPILITVALLVGDPALVRYGGLSGVGAGLLALLALGSLQDGEAGPRWCWWALLGLLVVKIALESTTRMPFLATFPEPDIRSVPFAHAAGVVTAVGIHGFRRRGRAGLKVI